MRCMNPTEVPKYVNGVRQEDQLVVVRCRRCLSCGAHAKNIWTGRCVMEMSTSQYSTFLTLTYASDDQGLAALNLRDLQLFLKRLRKCAPGKIRYLACGEYGSQSGRAHWHLITFHDFPLTVSMVEQAWNMPLHQGFIYKGEVNEKSIGYVAKYTLKPSSEAKIVTFSKQPGLGVKYLEIVGRTLSVKKSGLDSVPHQLRINGRRYLLDAYSQSVLSKQSGLPVSDRTPYDDWVTFWNASDSDQAAGWRKLEQMYDDLLMKESL